jgi:hypothetical protein
MRSRGRVGDARDSHTIFLQDTIFFIWQGELYGTLEAEATG